MNEQDPLDLNEGITNEPPVSYVPTSSPWAQLVRTELQNIHQHEGLAFDIIGPQNYQRLGMVSAEALEDLLNPSSNEGIHYYSISRH